MFIEQINASANLRSKKIEVNKPIWALLIVRQSYESFANALSSAPERVTVEVDSKTGRQISLMHRLPIGVPAHFGQYGEGIISEDFIPVGNPLNIGARAWRVRILVPLTQGKSIPLAANETLNINLENLREEGIYNVYGLEYPESGNSMYEYAVLGMPQGVRSKSFVVDGVEAIVLKQGAYLDRVSVTYKNGFRGNYTLPELVAINADNNDIEAVIRSIGGVAPEDETFVTQIVTVAQSAYVTLIVRDAVDIEIITDGSETQFYQVSVLNRLLS
jgi:hypothetical protein